MEQTQYLQPVQVSPNPFGGTSGGLGQIGSGVLTFGPTVCPTCHICPTCGRKQ